MIYILLQTVCQTGMDILPFTQIFATKSNYTKRKRKQIITDSLQRNNMTTKRAKHEETLAVSRHKAIKKTKKKKKKKKKKTTTKNKQKKTPKNNRTTALEMSFVKKLPDVKIDFTSTKSSPLILKLQKYK